MTTALLLATSLLASPQAAPPAATEASPAASPCVAATAECTEWVPDEPGVARTLVYRTYPLDVRHEGITRALVMVHGQGRDADNYFRTSVAAAFLAGALGDTLVVSLRFASSDGRCQDRLADREVSWPCGGVSWRAGGAAVSVAGMTGPPGRVFSFPGGTPPPGTRPGSDYTSYDLADLVLRKLARKDIFPNLRAIVLAGHSAGGQFASRYAMSNVVHEALGVPVTYVVANPSSYGYPGPERPSASVEGFGSYADGRNCTAYNRWPYGLEERAGYAASVSDDQLTRQLVSRPVVYLLGELDTTPLAGFDASCPAMAQGPNRLERGKSFAKYVNERLGARHVVAPVPLCGHNARCMFTSEIALPILFPAASSR